MTEKDDLKANYVIYQYSWYDVKQYSLPVFPSRSCTYNLHIWCIFLLIANKLSGTKHGYFSAIIVLITFRFEHGRGLSSIVENILMAHIEFIVL